MRVSAAPGRLVSLDDVHPHVVLRAESCLLQLMIELHFMVLELRGRFFVFFLIDQAVEDFLDLKTTILQNFLSLLLGALNLPGPHFGKIFKQGWRDCLFWDVVYLGQVTLQHLVARGVEFSSGSHDPLLLLMARTAVPPPSQVVFPGQVNGVLAHARACCKSRFVEEAFVRVDTGGGGSRASCTLFDGSVVDANAVLGQDFFAFGHVGPLVVDPVFFVLQIVNVTNDIWVQVSFRVLVEFRRYIIQFW